MNWKNRLVKTMVVSSIVGVVVGLVPGIVMLASGKIDSDERIEFMMFLIAFPAVTAVVIAVASAVAIGILRYVNWISGGRISARQDKSDERFE